MIARSLLISLITAVSVSSGFAEMRPWKNTDGTRSVQGNFVNRNATSVTLKTEAGKEILIELSQLHADDLQWLETHHSLNQARSDQDPAAFFDNLTFRDTRTTTEAKLKASKLVEMTTDGTFLGRSGLNGEIGRAHV